ncbi:SRPBCC family protein [Gordonia sp. (in: high G+C Gram-positive bacteria)]|uniref:SRPBCC family protein n=1 Tax=Gordonia sp. (in: high G+C Gram-positive bacteria) TaxID=84139 RepID=UPI0039E2247B
MLEPEHDPSVIDLGIFVEQPPEVAWRALTQPESLARWLSPTIGFEPVVGTTFIVQVEVPDKPAAEMACQILAADEPNQLTYSWTDLRGDPPRRWLIDYQLHPHGRGTRLMWHMSGFDIEDKYQRFARNGIERSWDRTLLPKLAAEINALGASD